MGDEINVDVEEDKAMAKRAERGESYFVMRARRSLVSAMQLRVHA